MWGDMGRYGLAVEAEEHARRRGLARVRLEVLHLVSARVRVRVRVGVRVRVRGLGLGLESCPTSQMASGAASGSICDQRSSSRLQKARLLRRSPWRMCTARPSARRSLKAPCGVETISRGASLAC